MNSHTPGPWEVVSELRDTDEIICDMMNSGYVAVTQGQKLSNWRDDARLIATAPDLLEALESVERCGFDNEDQSGWGEIHITSEDWRALRAAISRAKGLTS